MRIYSITIGLILFFIGVYDVLCPTPTPKPTPDPTVTNVVPTDTAVIPTVTAVPTFTVEPTPTIGFTETITPVISTSVFTYTEETVVPGIVIRKGNGSTPTPSLDMPDTGYFEDIRGWLLAVVGCIVTIAGVKLFRVKAKL